MKKRESNPTKDKNCSNAYWSNAPLDLAIIGLACILGQPE